MSLAELQKEALDLPEKERALLVVSLLETLALEDDEISDDEVLRRDADLEGGRESEISHQEFVRRVQSERKRDRLRLGTTQPSKPMSTGPAPI